MKIEFEPTNYKDASFVLKAIQELCPSSFNAIISDRAAVSPRGEMYQGFVNDNLEKDKKIKELEKQLEQCKRDCEAQEEKIAQKDKEIGTLTKEVDNLSQKNEEERRFHEMERKEFEQKEIEFNQTLSKKDDAYRKLQRDQGNEINGLKKKNLELQKQLEQFIPNIESVSGDIKYFQVDGDKLMETNSDDAYYQARIGNDRNCAFQFNIEKGHVKEACSNRDSILLPFCNIIEEHSQGNNIAPGKWGKATLTSSGELIIIEKAEIKLTRI